MATPPPLHPKQQPATPANPAHAPKPAHTPTPSPAPSQGKNPWLIAGCVLAGLLLIAAVLLYLLTDLFGQDGYDYDDGNRNEKVLRDKDRTDADEPRPDVIREEPLTAVPDSMPAPGAAYAPGKLHGIGHNGSKAISMDISIDPDGNVSGTYWNMIYSLQFDIAGRRLPDGTLDLTLTTVKDHISTPLRLVSSNGYSYSGTWGKKQHPVDIELYEGGFQYTPAPNAARFHVKGPGNTSVLNEDFCITQDNDGTMYFWYPSQGYQNRMKADKYGPDFVIYDRNGTVQARISFHSDEDQTGVMTDSDGQTFTVTALP